MILIKRLSLYSVLLLAFCSLLAQTTVFELRNSLGEKYTGFDIHDITFDETSKEITLSGLNWTKGWLNEKNEADGGKKLSIVTGAGIRGTEVSQPVLTILKLDASGRVLNKIEEPIHLSGVFSKLSKEDPYVVNHYGSLMLWIDSNDAKSVEDLKSQYPKAFPKEGEDYETTVLEASESGFVPAYLRKQVTVHEYKKWQGSYKTEAQEWQSVGFDKVNKFEYPSGGYVFDKDKKQILYPVKAQPTDRISGFYNKQVYLLDENGTVLNNAAITLEQPKDFKYIGGLSNSVGDPSFEKGAILIYGKAQLRKKKNDQDLTRHYVVFLDEYGALTHQSEFHLGEDGQYLQLYSSFTQGDKIFVFGRLMNKDKPGHVVLEFDQNGFVNSKLYSYQEMQALLVGDSEPALKTFMRIDFDPYVTTRLADGRVVIAGETFEKEKETLPPAEGQSFGETINHQYLLSRIFLVFDQEGNWVGYYSKKRPEEKSEKKSKLVEIRSTANAVYYHDQIRKKLLVLDLENDSVKELDSVDRIVESGQNQMILFNDWNSAGQKEFNLQIID